MKRLSNIVEELKGINPKRVIAVTLVSAALMFTPYFIISQNIKHKYEPSGRTKKQELVLKHLNSIPRCFENQKAAFRYLMVRELERGDVHLNLWNILYSVELENNKIIFPDILIEVPHSRGTGLVYIFIPDNDKNMDDYSQLNDFYDRIAYSRIIRVLDLPEKTDKKTRTSLYTKLDRIILEAMMFYNKGSNN